MACINCSEYTCAKPVPTSADFLDIGKPIYSDSGEVRVWIKKVIGGDIVSYPTSVLDYASSSTGNIVIDLSYPSESFFNDYDGIYKIWATEKDDDSGAEPLMLLVGSTQATCWGVEFVRTIDNPFDTVTIVPVS